MMKEKDTSGAVERYVTFVVAGETYAVPALAVREVVRWMPVTRIPHGALAVKGVINLRGEIVPLVDLRVHLGLAPVDATDRTCIVVVSVQRGASRIQAGLIVDVALEVTRIAVTGGTADGGALPGSSGRYVTSIAQTKGGLVILLDCAPLVIDALSTGHASPAA